MELPKLTELDVLAIMQHNPAAAYAKHCQDVALKDGLRPAGKMRSAVFAHEERVKKAVEEDLRPLRKQAERMADATGGNVLLVLDELIRHAWDSHDDSPDRRYAYIQRAKALRYLLENE